MYDRLRVPAALEEREEGRGGSDGVPERDAPNGCAGLAGCAARPERAREAPRDFGWSDVRRAMRKERMEPPPIHLPAASRTIKGVFASRAESAGKRSTRNLYTPSSCSELASTTEILRPLVGIGAPLRRGKWKVWLLHVGFAP